MSAFSEVVIWTMSELLVLYILGVGVLYVTARGALKREFKDDQRDLLRISRFRGFTDLGSIQKAMTSVPYEVCLGSEGEEVMVFCLVRRVPVVGYAWAVERWSEEKSQNDS